MEQEVEKLKDSFLEEEIFGALFDLNEDKALGLNGFFTDFW